MAKIQSKGTLLKLSIATVYTSIASLVELDPPEAEVETYQATDFSSGVGHIHLTTGYVEGGTCSGTVWFDPVAATHQAITDLITTPTDGSQWKIVWADGASTELVFAGVTKKFKPMAKMNEGLKASFSVQLSGIATYPT